MATYFIKCKRLAGKAETLASTKLEAQSIFSWKMADVIGLYVKYQWRSLFGQFALGFIWLHCLMFSFDVDGDGDFSLVGSTLSPNSVPIARKNRCDCSSRETEREREKKAEAIDWNPVIVITESAPQISSDTFYELQLKITLALNKLKQKSAQSKSWWFNFM